MKTIRITIPEIDATTTALATSDIQELAALVVLIRQVQLLIPEVRSGALTLDAHHAKLTELKQYLHTLENAAVPARMTNIYRAASASVEAEINRQLTANSYKRLRDATTNWSRPFNRQSKDNS